MSAWTTKFSTNKTSLYKNIYKSFRHLIVPALTIFSIRTIIHAAEIISTATTSDWKRFIIQTGLSLLFCSGVDNTFSGVSVPAIGIPWFLVVLFFSRTIYDSLQLIIKRDSIFVAIILSLSLLGIVIGTRVYLFFSLDIAFAVLSLTLFAQLAHRYYLPGMSTKLLIISLIIWIICFLLPYFVMPAGQSGKYLEFAYRNYPLFPICFVGSISATLFISEICARLNSCHLPIKVVTAVNYLGKNSLYMLYVHCFDDYWKFLYSFTGNKYLKSVYRVVADIIAFALLMKIRSLIINRRQNVIAL